MAVIITGISDDEKLFISYALANHLGIVVTGCQKKTNQKLNKNKTALQNFIPVYEQIWSLARKCDLYLQKIYKFR